MSNIKLSLCRERLTGRGGFLLLSELWAHLGVSRLLDRALPQPGSGRGFKPSVMVWTVVTLLFSGAEHLSDIRHLAWDSLVLALSGLRKLPASNTLTTWLNRCERWVTRGHRSSRENVTLRGIKRVHRELLGVLARLLKKRRLVLDVDATIVRTKKKTARICYKGFPSYQPQLAYLSGLRVFLGSQLRPGNDPSSKDVLDYLDDCMASMPDGTSISVLRADAAYYQRDVLRWCLDNGIDFVIRAGRDEAVMKEVDLIEADEWRPYVDSDGIEHPDAQVAWCYHSMDGVRWFRLAVIRRRCGKGKQLDLFDGEYIYCPIATSLRRSAEEVVHLYNQRGKAEDGIGQLKCSFGLASMPCSDFQANAVWVGIGLLSFTFFALFKLALGEGWAVRKLKTVQFHMLNVPGRLVSHAGEVVLKLSCSKEFLAFFADSHRRCRTLLTQFG